jgi:hypothetical protein
MKRKRRRQREKGDRGLVGHHMCYKESARL